LGSGQPRTTTFSTIDTNVTTFSIKSPLDRVITNKKLEYGVPVDTKNIRIRFQELRESEVERLYELLKHGTSHFSLFHVT
jgi:hypothetical protein